MALRWPCFLSCLLTAVLVFPLSSAAFDTPLSDTAVREAYFMGQRHDESLARFFDRYKKHLPPPKNGSNITNIAFFTPFARVAELSDRQGDDYSAQQAQIDHRTQGEFVRVVIQMDYTDSYAFSRPPGFWNNFAVRVFDQDKLLKPVSSHAVPNYVCSSEGGCSITGTTFNLDFSAESFTGSSAVVQVHPPEGDDVTVSFDLSALR